MRRGICINYLTPETQCWCTKRILEGREVGRERKMTLREVHTARELVTLRLSLPTLFPQPLLSFYFTPCPIIYYLPFAVKPLIVEMNTEVLFRKSNICRLYIIYQEIWQNQRNGQLPPSIRSPPRPGVTRVEWHSGPRELQPRVKTRS